MTIHSIRDSSEARSFFEQGIWWQRVLPPSASSLRSGLIWAKELASEGHPLPPLGFIVDVGHAAFGDDHELRTSRESLTVPNLPINLLRTYEDQVLGKLYADYTFSRASDALHKYAPGREQSRGLAYLLEQFRERAKFDCVEVPVGVINAMLDTSPEEILSEGYESLRLQGPHRLLHELYESLIHCTRQLAEILAPEDVFDLEQKAALEDLSQRLAHRQVLRAAAEMEGILPRHKIRPLARRMEVPTRILDEDTYPVGGFTSISNRGSIESLLHSQLAYMEPQRDQQPDLFDTLFLLDELLYYSRDENQFLRRRRTFVLALSPDLVETRFKDSDLPFQRGVFLLGLVYVLVTRLIGWLSTDSLYFQIVFHTNSDQTPLAPERALLERLFHEEIALGIVTTQLLNPADLPNRCTQWSRKSMVHCLLVGVDPPPISLRDVVVNRLAIQSSRPLLADADQDWLELDGEDAADAWANSLQQILMRWI